MKVQALSLVSPAPLNLTNQELAAHVRHEFPNLSGSLLMLLDRFEGRRDSIGRQNCDAMGDLPNEPTPTEVVRCCKCGTDLVVPLVE